eukprot:4991815-Prymnesium_polylepis.1
MVLLSRSIVRSCGLSAATHAGHAGPPCGGQRACGGSTLRAQWPPVAPRAAGCWRPRRRSSAEREGNAPPALTM